MNWALQKLDCLPKLDLYIEKKHMRNMVLDYLPTFALVQNHPVM